MNYVSLKPFTSHVCAQSSILRLTGSSNSAKRAWHDERMTSLRHRPQNGMEAPAVQIGLALVRESQGGDREGSGYVMGSAEGGPEGGGGGGRIHNLVHAC